MENIIYHRHNIALYNVLNQEVVFEEYFCNLLQFDDFRDLFIDFINEQSFIKFDKNKIKYYDFNTEVKIEDDGRADLFLNYENQEYIFEIKNKDRTNLTPNQPKGYLKYLENQNLFFLIPRNYKHKIDIIDRWQDYCNNENIENHIFYWEDFIRMLEKSGIHKKYTEIKIFYDFCSYWFNIELIEFSNIEKEILKKGYIVNDFKNKTIPVMLQKLESIIDNIAENCKLKKDNDVIGYNYSLEIKQYILYIGINYELWNEIGMPISIEIQNKELDYQEFDLELNGINLNTKLYQETATTDKQFSLYVDLVYSIDNRIFQEETTNLILNIIEQLKNIQGEK